MATAFTIAGLTSELTNDPKSLGFSNLKGQFQVQANLLNALTGAGTGNTPREPQPSYLLLTLINATDLNGLTAAQVSILQVVLATQTINLSDANTQAILLLIFGGTTTTKNAIIAAVNRTGSRAEVLWGTGTIITPAQVALAGG